MANAKLVLLRHGQTPDNVAHINTGHRDVPLTEVGTEQARAAGGLIKDIVFDKVFCSPLIRAFNTASLALETAGQNTPIEKHRDIIEGDDGDLTGRGSKDPFCVDYYQRSTYDMAPPGGESQKQLVARVKKFYEEVVMPCLERGENVLVTAHCGTIRAFDVAMGLSPVPVDGEPWKNLRPVPNAGPEVHEYESGVLKKSYAFENLVTTIEDNKQKQPAANNNKSRPEF